MNRNGRLVENDLDSSRNWRGVFRTFENRNKWINSTSSPFSIREECFIRHQFTAFNSVSVLFRTTRNKLIENLYRPITEECFIVHEVTLFWFSLSFEFTGQWYRWSKKRIVFCLSLKDFGFANSFNKNEKLKTFCGSPAFVAKTFVLIFRRKNNSFSTLLVTQRRSSFSARLILQKKLMFGFVENLEHFLDHFFFGFKSLGVLLYVFVCGKLPFEASNFFDLRTKILIGKFFLPFTLSKSSSTEFSLRFKKTRTVHFFLSKIVLR